MVDCGWSEYSSMRVARNRLSCISTGTHAGLAVTDRIHASAAASENFSFTTAASASPVACSAAVPCPPRGAGVPEARSQSPTRFAICAVPW